MPAKLNSEIATEILALWQQHLSISEIADELSISIPSTRKILRQNGIETPAITKKDSCYFEQRIPLMIELFNEGKSIPEIAKILQSTPKTIRAYLRGEGIEKVTEGKVKQTTPKKSFIDPKVFIRAWQAGRSVTQVATDLGITKQAASLRATTFRKHGVPLKKMPVISDENWSELAEFAQSLLPRKEE